MKKLLLILGLVISSLCSAQNTGSFFIHAKLSGLKKGVEVSILKAERPLNFDRAKSNASADAFEGEGIIMEVPEEKAVAVATVTKNGVLEIRGTIDRPQMVHLVTNNLEMVTKQNEGKDDAERWKGVRWTYTPIFLENCEFTIGTNKYELLTDAPITDQCVIKGGQAQDDFNAYNLLLQEAQAGKEYLEDKERDAVAWKFIESHPTSVVSVYLADKMLEDSPNMTSEQIKRLTSSVTSCPSDTARYNAFVRKAQVAALTAAGNPVVDLELVTDKGEAATLVKAIPAGKIVLVDFWASWCGICRAYTPEIKELYNKYPRDRFEVISVSCDTSEKRWRSAMEKDQMPWAQFLMTKQGYSDFFAKYQTNGVPYLLLVDSEGRVISNPGSPAKAQVLLEKMLGE